MKKLNRDFYNQNAINIAPILLGSIIVIKQGKKINRHIITELEVYQGEEDLACHANKGRTKRTEIMYHEGGHIYMYLIYGIHWMFNIVCGKNNDPQAILIRGIEHYNGPGKLTKALQLNDSFYGIDLCKSDKIWIEKDQDQKIKYITSPRINIDYAKEPWLSKKWRFQLMD